MSVARFTRSVGGDLSDVIEGVRSTAAALAATAALALGMGHELHKGMHGAVPVAFTVGVCLVFFTAAGPGGEPLAPALPTIAVTALLVAARPAATTPLGAGRRSPAWLQRFLN